MSQSMLAPCPSSPRGLLAKYLFSEDNNALQFEFISRKDLYSPKTQVHILNGFKEHDNFLLNALEYVKKEMTIITPWLTYEKIEQSGILQAMSQACQRGVSVIVVTDRIYNTGNGDYQERAERRQTLKSALHRLESQGITTQLVKRVHSKIVIIDDSMLCVGSFNWFSASRDVRYDRFDTSMVYQGSNLTDEISSIQNNLHQRSG
ncbi:phospholipase D-like domain-containing protein [Photorhabdus heterorhabditis]|uniref:phospholipase D-like domain-containing protein n=1 Tax=Photorhabdus heterorhabditis TaxID=880156 RepID=UPI001BD3164B|nr:phospholipase D-like domain-containing protein [Photorhabdus heterorhabditis]